MTVDVPSLLGYATLAGTLLAAFFIAFQRQFKDHRDNMNLLATTVNDTITIGLKDVSASWKTNQEITRDSLAQKDLQFQAVISRLDVVEKTALNYKELADQSLLDRDGLHDKINAIMAAREQTKAETDQKITAIQAALTNANRQISELSAQLQTKQLETDQAQTKLNTITDLYNELSLQKNNLETELTAKIDALEKRLIILEQQVNQQMSTIKELEQIITSKDNEITQMKQERDAALATLAAVQAERDELRSQLQPVAVPSASDPTPEAKA